MIITLYTIGFTNKSAQKFFELLRLNQVKLLVDTRRNNKSQLAGFAKGSDLKFFISQILGVDYIHELRFAPTDDLLQAYRKKEITWEEYEVKYLNELMGRNILEGMEINKYSNAVFLCSEHLPQKCHRRLLVEYLQKNFVDVEIKHLI